MPRIGNEVPFTGHAMRALQLSIAFSQTFPGQEKVPLLHSLALDTPPGTSTGGGENVTQSVKLTVGRTTPIVIATANAAKRIGEVSTYDAAVEAFARANTGAPFPFERAQYAALQARLAAFFAKERIAIAAAAADAAHAAPRIAELVPEPAPRSRMGLFVAIGVIVIVATAVVVVFVLR